MKFKRDRYLRNIQAESDNATGYGLAVLRDGDNITVDFGINYEFILLPVSDSSKEVKNFMNNRTVQLEASEVGDYASFLFEVLKRTFTRWI